MHAQHRSHPTVPLFRASVILAATLALSSCSGESDPSLETHVPVLSTMKNTHSQESTTNSGEPGSMDSGYIDKTLNDGAATWNFPLVYKDWTATPADAEGKSQLDHTNGCKFFANQNYSVTPEAGSDGDATKAQVTAWQSEIASSAIDPVFNSETSSDIRGIGNSSVETIRVNTTYNGQDGVPYRSTAWFRTFTTPEKPAAVSLHYVCPADAYNENDLKGLLDNTRLMNVKQSSMQQ